MTFDLYTASHKTWDHVGNLTPNTEYSEATRPHGEYMVADWLPVGRYDKFYEQYFVVSAGKAVAFDRTGRVVPAGLKVAFAVTSGDVLSYVAADVTQGVIDITTGVPVAGACGYTAAEIATGLVTRGLLDGSDVASDFISFPVGVAPYNYIQWCGGDGFNPNDYRQHNYNMQHRVAILCKYVIEVPLVPAAIAYITPSGADTIVDTAVSAADDYGWTSHDADGQWFSATGLALEARYSADIGASPKNPNVVGLNLPHMHLAKNTSVTPWVLDDTGDFVREVESIAELTTAGDYFIDYEVGMILFYEEGGNAALTLSNHIHYYHYDSPITTTAGSYVCATGPLMPGDFVSVDANSNFIQAPLVTTTEVDTVTSGDPETSLTTAEMTGCLNLVEAHQRGIIGQVLDLEVFPKDFLERVRTAFPQLTTVDQMPGSASAGLPDKITYAGGSNKTVRILLLK